MLLNRDSGSKQKMDGSTLIETLFSIKATIGVVIFALVPLARGHYLENDLRKEGNGHQIRIIRRDEDAGRLFCCGNACRFNIPGCGILALGRPRLQLFPSKLSGVGYDGFGSLRPASLVVPRSNFWHCDTRGGFWVPNHRDA